MDSKRYGGYIYIKEHLQNILNTDILKSTTSSISVLFYPEDVPIEKVISSLETIKTNLEDELKNRMGNDVDNEENKHRR
jgi:hypothetical protein